MTNLDIAIILLMLGVLLLLGLGAFIEDKFPRVRNRYKRYVHPKNRRKGVKR